MNKDLFNEKQKNEGFITYSSAKHDFFVLIHLS